MKSELVERVAELLRSAAFEVSICSGMQSCFDVIAKKEKTILIKVLTNVEGLTDKHASDLKALASLLGASPLVISERMKSSKLSDGVVYTRYDLQIMNAKTFENVISGNFPHVHSVRGNYCMSINPKGLSKLRQKLNLTQQDLADRLNISKQSIYRYEHTGKISLDVAEKLMQIFEENLLAQDEFLVSTKFRSEMAALDQYLTELQRIVVKEFKEIGFRTSVTNAPFDVLAKENEMVFTIASDDSRRLEKKAALVTEISEMFDAYKLCISNRRQDLEIVVMKPGELGEVRNPRELIRILKKE